MRASEIDWKNVRDVIRSPEGDFIWRRGEWIKIVYDYNEEALALLRRRNGLSEAPVGGAEDKPQDLV